MRPPLRSLIGMIALVLWVACYALVMVALIGIKARNFGPVGEPIFYVIAGIGWVPVAMLLIRWMAPRKAS